MATSSFEEMLVIDTPEVAERLLEAFREAEKRGPYVPKCGNFWKMLEEGEKHIMDIVFPEDVQ